MNRLREVDLRGGYANGDGERIHEFLGSRDGRVFYLKLCA